MGPFLSFPLDAMKTAHPSSFPFDATQRTRARAFRPSRARTSLIADQDGGVEEEEDNARDEDVDSEEEEEEIEYDDDDLGYDYL